MKKLIKCLFVGALLLSFPQGKVMNIDANVPSEAGMKLPSAPDTSVKKTDLVQLDYSNVNEGYFQVKTLNANHKCLKVQVFKVANDTTPQKYDINKDYQYETIPLMEGNGEYLIKVYENTQGNKYAVLISLTFNITLSSAVFPYLYPNQIVDYNADTKAVDKAFELIGNQSSELERIKKVYGYVVDNVKYDWDKVQQVQGIYVLTGVDTTLNTLKGICFDYAALTETMLRSQGIPTKVVTGYVDEGYHAWIEVYASEVGWINPARYFYSDSWNSTDPTFDASNKNYKGSYQIKYNY